LARIERVLPFSQLAAASQPRVPDFALFHSPAGRDVRISPSHVSKGAIMDRNFSRFRPQLESLNDRIVPSVTWSVNAGVLTITGTQGADTVDIQDDGTNLTVTADGETLNLPTDGSVTDVVLHLGAGADVVTYTLTGDLAAGTTRKLDACLGNGDDTFTATLNGNLLDGSSLDVKARGMNGQDNLSFAAAASNVAAGASLAVTLNGGNGKDTINASYAGQLLGDFTFSADGGNGKDVIAGNLTFDAGSTGTVDAQVLGKNAPDTLTLMVVDNSGNTGTTTGPSTLASLTATVDGGHGPDSATVSDNVDVISAKTM
jgi:hypothetical protein